jgi:hypothetical protein
MTIGCVEREVARVLTPLVQEVRACMSGSWATGKNPFSGGDATPWDIIQSRKFERSEGNLDPRRQRREPGKIDDAREIICR